MNAENTKLKYKIKNECQKYKIPAGRLCTEQSKIQLYTKCLEWTCL